MVHGGARATPFVGPKSNPDKLFSEVQTLVEGSGGGARGRAGGRPRGRYATYYLPGRRPTREKAYPGEGPYRETRRLPRRRLQPPLQRPPGESYPAAAIA
ncbi:hypothetical protein VTK73DRAFT_9067 [Phialemonium thermophilum]|uniref:Uncharacterized protein n=1 Tax=Phialemonium thermophilum TaxID=223376 RepID=A0ABR3W533_9PEZI